MRGHAARRRLVSHGTLSSWAPADRGICHARLPPRTGDLYPPHRSMDIPDATGQTAGVFSGLLSGPVPTAGPSSARNCLRSARRAHRVAVVFETADQLTPVLLLRPPRKKLSSVCVLFCLRKEDGLRPLDNAIYAPVPRSQQEGRNINLPLDTDRY